MAPRSQKGSTHDKASRYRAKDCYYRRNGVGAERSGSSSPSFCNTTDLGSGRRPISSAVVLQISKLHLLQKSRFSANALAADGALLGAARRPIGACWYLTCSAKCARPTGAPLGEISEAFDASGPQELQQTDLRPCGSTYFAGNDRRCARTRAGHARTTLRRCPTRTAPEKNFRAGARRRQRPAAVGCQRHPRDHRAR